VSHNLNEVSKPFTMPHFIGWLGKHDRAQTYDYRSCDDCLVTQYYKEHGGLYVSPGFGMAQETDIFTFIRQAEWISRGSTEVDEWTFGQALDRALEHTQVMAIA
jgi:hypothetical protein